LQDADGNENDPVVVQYEELKEQLDAAVAAIAAAAAEDGQGLAAPPLPASYDYHFFVSKHELLGKDRAEHIANTLRDAGYAVWFSDWEKKADRAIDAEAMADGIKRSAAVLLLLTPGIFCEDRVNVTHLELKPAMDAGKLVVCVQGPGFSDTYHRCHGLGSGCLHFNQTCKPEPGHRVAADFQPYARAILDLGHVHWGRNPYEVAEFRRLVATFFTNRKDKAAKMQRDLAKQTALAVALGPCSETDE